MPAFSGSRASRRSRVQRTSDGGLAVDQGVHHGLAISWNPDDDRFYVEAPEEEAGCRGIALATFAAAGAGGPEKGLQNAIQFARRKAQEVSR